MGPGSVISPLWQLHLGMGWTPATTSFAQLGPADVLLCMKAKPRRVDIVCPWADVSLRVRRWGSKCAETIYFCYYKGGGTLCWGEESLNGRQQAAGSGIWGQGLPRGTHVATDEMESVFSVSKFISIRDVASPGEYLLFLGSATAPVACSHGSSASHSALSLQHLFLPSFLCRSQGRIHYGVTISPSCLPSSSAPWHSLCLRSNSGCQHSQENIFSLP